MWKGRSCSEQLPLFKLLSSNVLQEGHKLVEEQNPFKVCWFMQCWINEENSWALLLGRIFKLWRSFQPNPFDDSMSGVVGLGKLVPPASQIFHSWHFASGEESLHWYPVSVFPGFLFFFLLIHDFWWTFPVVAYVCIWEEDSCYCCGCWPAGSWLYLESWWKFQVSLTQICARCFGFESTGYAANISSGNQAEVWNTLKRSKWMERWEEGHEDSGADSAVLKYFSPQLSGLASWRNI